MNKNRRKSLRRALSYLDSAICIIRDAKDEEQDCLDNLPENLQSSERYEAMENAVDDLDNAVSSLRDASTSIDDAISRG